MLIRYILSITVTDLPEMFDPHSTSSTNQWVYFT